MNGSVTAKYSAAFLQLTIALAGALIALRGPVTVATVLHLVPLAVNVVLVYFVPLFGVNARSGWKTGAAIAVAVAAAAVPYATTGHLTGQQALVVLLAGLQALGAHIGVQIRNDSGSDTSWTPTADLDDAAPASPTEPPTDTTITRAINSNGGEFLGDPAR